MLRKTVPAAGKISAHGAPQGRWRVQRMIFGHNTNLKLGNVTFHVQTEDRGESHALLDTTVYYRGRVLHRRTNNYFDLLPLNPDREEALRLRLDEQHRTVIEEIRSGALYLTVPTEGASPAAAPPAVPVPPSPQPSSEIGKLTLELVNARSWLQGRRARLQVAVLDASGKPVPGAEVKVEIEGCEGGESCSGKTGAAGQVEIAFDMPRITSPEAALVVHAQHGVRNGQLRFALRAKPRVHSV
jgi:hypothetical protein